MFSREAVKRPFPERWREMLRANAPFYAELSEADRGRFEGLLDDFATSKRFELEIDPLEHELARVLVSAAACRLSLNLIETYTRLTSIHVVRRREDLHETATLLGYAVDCTGVAVVWSDFLEGFREPDDGDNVGYHEFAHILDASDGTSDGVPPLLFARPGELTKWRATFAQERENVASGRCRWVSGARLDVVVAHPQEMFADAVEAYFERPELLRFDAPELYKLLKRYFG